MKKTTNKMMKKAMGLKGFLNSMSKPKMKKGGFPDLNKDGEITKADILMGRGVISKPKMGFGGIGRRKPTNMTPVNSLSMKEQINQFGNNERFNKMMSGAPQSDGVYRNYKKGGMSKMAKEAAKNTKPTIPHSYYQMGGMNEMNPLSSMFPKKPIKSMKPKMAMGGDFFPQNPLTASKYKGDTLMGQSFKKGGMTKKKKK